VTSNTTQVVVDAKEDHIIKKDKADFGHESGDITQSFGCD
jgi:hypothetical protein